MRFERKIFTSKVAWRIFATFVICSLTPLFCLSVLAYIQVTQQLKTQAFKDLRYAAKTQAKTLSDRLKAFEKEFELIESYTRHDSKAKSQVLPDPLRRRLSKTFHSITYFVDQKQSHTLLNKLPFNSLTFTLDEKAHMADGHTLLVEKTIEQATPLVLMVRPVSSMKNPTDYFVGEIKFEYLWSPDELDNLPADTEYCVLGHTGSLIYSSRPYLSQIINIIKKDMVSAVSGHFNITADGKEYFASHTCVSKTPFQAIALEHYSL